MSQPALFGTPSPPAIEPPWSIRRCRNFGEEVGGYREAGRRTTFGYIRPDGVYQRGTNGIGHMLYRKTWVSYGTEEWRAAEGCAYLVTVDNLTRAWLWIAREDANRGARVDETYTGHRILVPLHLHGEVVP